MNIINKPYVRRAIRTFFQAAAGCVVVNIATTDMSSNGAVKLLVISSVAAGISAAMNLSENK